MKKNLIIFIASLLLLVTAVYALQTLEITSPSNNPEYWILGGNVEGNITVSVNASTSNNWTINCSLWTNETGTWKVTATNNTISGNADTSAYDFDTITLADKLDTRNVTDNQVITYGFVCSDNDTNTEWTSNQTIRVEDAPTVTLNSPADASTSSSQDITLNVTVTGDGITYTCYTFSNDTGTWGEDGSFTTITNDTASIYTRQYTEGNVLWNVKCFERTATGEDKYPNVYGWATNQTITVDVTVPTMAITSPADNGYFKSASNKFNITATDINIDTCVSYVNSSINYTDTSITSGSATLIDFNASDGVFSWYVTCNDSSGNSASTTARTVTKDTVYPTLTSVANYSQSSCIGFGLNVTASESSAVSIAYGTTGAASDGTDTETIAVSTYPTVTFNNNYETTYYYNITLTDAAGNANSTITQNVHASPFPLCTGWSLMSIYSEINLSDLYINSGTDYIYWWNDTSQSWLYHTAAASTWGSHNIQIGEVAWIYTDTDTSYFRDTSAVTQIKINLTSGHNYVGLYGSYDFGNLSYEQFRNSSSGNQTIQNKQFQIEYISAFNNSAKSWVSSIYTWKTNNGTKLKGISHLDAIWVYSDYNISLNLSAGAGGYVYGNWS